MHEQTELELSYRRLLSAYPRFYRRHRGLEIVTTMMDAAKPGQARPSRSEVIHLLLSGLRCRLVPPGWAGKIAAGVVTLWVAVILSGVGAYVSWGSHLANPPYPDDPKVAELSDALVGQRTSWLDTAGRGGLLAVAYSHKSRGELQTFATEGWAAPRPYPHGLTRVYEHAGSSQAILTNAHQRLRDQGWQIGALTQQEACGGCEVFWASHDGLLLRISGADASDKQSVIVRVYRAEPKGVLEAAIAGFVLGLVLAWPMMTWLVHRIARLSSGDKMLTLVFGLPALYACVASTVDNVASMVPDSGTASALLATDLLYPLASQAANPLAAIVIALGLAASLGIITFAPWQRRHRAAGQP